MFGQEWLYLDKVVVFGQSNCVVVKWLYSGKSGCIWAKVVVFEQKWLYSGKCGFIRAKVVIFGKIGCIR